MKKCHHPIDFEYNKNNNSINEEINKLEDKISTLHDNISHLCDMVSDVKHSVSEMANKRSDQLLGWGIGIIGFLTASIVGLIAYIAK